MLYSSISQLKLYAAKLKPNPEIDSTYQADAFNMDTLDHELYTDVTFFDVRHPDLLYCFQMLFPLFTIVLLVVYGRCSYHSLKAYVEKQIRCSSSWATVTAHAIISLAFTVFVVILDIVALPFRNKAPDYYTESFNAHLFHYPGLTLFWDGIAFLTSIALVIIMVCHCVVCHCLKHEQSRLKEKLSQMEFVFLLLLFAGVVPLLCLASHAHYIFIAAITDPFYATGIGIYYGIFYYVHLSLLKRTYEGVDQCAPNVQLTSVQRVDRRDDEQAIAKLDGVDQCAPNVQLTSVQQVDHRNDDQAKAQPDNQNIEEYVAHFNYKAMIWVFGVFFVTVCYQILITVFYVFLPINHSVENVPSRLFLILQVASALLVSLLAYKIAFGLRETPTLSAISSAIRKFLLKKGEHFKTEKQCHVYNKMNWDTLDEDKKLAFLLPQLYDSMNIETKQPKKGTVTTGAVTNGTATTGAATNGAVTNGAVNTRAATTEAATTGAVTKGTATTKV